MSRLLPTVFQLDGDMVDVLDDVARGLGVSRSHVARAYLEEALRSRLLWPRPPGSQPASSDDARTAPPTSAEATSSDEEAASSIAPACEPDAASPPTSAPTQAGAVPRARRKPHPWNGRARISAKRDPSLRDAGGNRK